uniref:Uncharacterized protein n=1 Tax=Anguilla anguilla TaxID=7936 RepID=A0A0E9PLG5_ANGAN
MLPNSRHKTILEDPTHGVSPTLAISQKLTGVSAINYSPQAESSGTLWPLQSIPNQTS